MGRPYTLKEQKQIVDYLIQHQAYGEIRGRKMWVDMANSKVIDRTWQSMKETFLKRILPDIHNPYYKLSVEQISSFRKGCDVTEKNKAKLEISPVKIKSEPSSPKAEDERTGEATCSKIQNHTKSSTETFVLENCDDGSETLNDVEHSPGHKPTKSLRDLITYSEPLTPMLQEMIDDFNSDDDPLMQNVEDPNPSPPEITEENNRPNSTLTIRESVSYNNKTESSHNDNQTQSSKIKSLKLKKTQKGTWENKEPIYSSPVKDKEANNNDSEITNSPIKNSIVDTELPNNQEALMLKSQATRISTESSKLVFVDAKKEKRKEKRKRSRSLTNIEHKKKQKDKQRNSEECSNQADDTETFNSHPQAANLSIELSKNLTTNTNSNEHNKSDGINNTAEINNTTGINKTDDTNIPPNLVENEMEAGPNEHNKSDEINNTAEDSNTNKINKTDYTNIPPSLVVNEMEAGPNERNKSDEINNTAEINNTTEINKTDDTNIPPNLVVNEMDAGRNEHNKSDEINNTAEVNNTTKIKKTDNNNILPNLVVNEMEAGPNEHNKSDEINNTAEVNNTTEENKTDDTNIPPNLVVNEMEAGPNEHNKSIEINNTAEVNNTTEINKTDDTNIIPNLVLNEMAAGPSGLKIVENPCLKPVSISTEQFSQSKYSGSEKEKPCKETENQNIETEKTKSNHEKSEGNNEKNKIIESTRQNKYVNKAIECNIIDGSTSSGNHTESHAINKSTISTNQSNEVVLLKSHSESESDDFEPPKKIRARVKKSRKRALANIFGFSFGSVSKRTYKYGRTTTHRYRSHRNRRTSRNVSNWLTIGSDTSGDYMTDNESSQESLDAISKKYIPPKPIDLMQDKDGMLFVAGHKKKYPLVVRQGDTMEYTKLPKRDIKRLIDEPQQSQITAVSVESVSDQQQEPYWKEQFLETQKMLAEEKIRADELARLLQRANESKARQDAVPSAPILQPDASLSNTVTVQKQAMPAAQQHCKPEEMVRIKFTQNREIEFEGQWAHVTPVLEKMVAMFNNGNNSNLNIPLMNAVNKNADLNTKEQENIPQNSKNDAQNQNERIAKENKKSPKKGKVIEQEISTEESTNKAEQPSKPVPRTRTANKNTNNKPKENKKMPQEKKSSKVESVSSEKSSETESISSGKSTPVPTQEIRSKVDKIENEIFKTIEEIDKSEQSVDQNGNIGDTYVTKRKRGQPKKVSSSLSTTSVESSPKKPRTSRTSGISKKVKPSNKDESPLRDQVDGTANVEGGAINIAEGASNIAEVKSVRPVIRSKREPGKYGSDSGIQKKRIKATRSKTSLQNDSDDDNTRYMLPPKGRKNPTGRTYTQHLIIPNLDSSRVSESTQGYQESNPSPRKLTVRKKRIPSIGAPKRRLSNAKRKSSPYLADDDTSSITEAPIQKSTTNSTINSEVYRSESYQLLLPKAKPVVQLERIEENSVHNTTENCVRNFQAVTPLIINVNNEYYVPPNEQRAEELRSSENSSSFSLPLSPEISVVEKLSVSRDVITNSVEGCPCINATQSNDCAQVTDSNKYLISKVDVSMPLMQQNCEIHNNNPSNSNCETESLTEMSVNSKLPEESLDKRLQNLLLESAKKISESDLKLQSQQNMEVGEVIAAKTKTIRRSSTPRKRNSKKGAKTLSIEPVLEEHTEGCISSGRKSCPPVINVITCEYEINNNNETNIINENNNNNETNITNENNNNNEKNIINENNYDIKTKKAKAKKKKNIIRVKILRPRRSNSVDKTAKSISVYSDSGINETESYASECKFEDSSELIHNHSDTCLQHDRSEDSVQFIENPVSVISLVSSSADDNFEGSKHSNEEFVNPECFSSDAQDAPTRNFSDVSKPVSTNSSEQLGPRKKVYKTAAEFNASFGSLMTDDISDTPSPLAAPPEQPSKWYLFSEDSTTSATFDAQPQTKLSGYGSNLRDIFQSCAVPNLSTISERSKENESRPATIMSPESGMETFAKSGFEF